MSTVIEQALQARLVASAPRMDVVPVVLRYDPADPFAVRMAFPAPATLEGVEAEWAFSRDLLAAGADAPAGVGDVRIRPYRPPPSGVVLHTRARGGGGARPPGGRGGGAPPGAAAPGGSRPPPHDRTVVEFHAVEGVAVVHVRTSEVRRFLRRTRQVVPSGCEYLFLDLDRDLAHLLRDAR
ncbi:SsgA family sporulation/cell division regulator [Streptomyces fradiae]|uniref:SsgA family sporulation/cell division regulator n=1 Tax=Streptomyces fradiae TaxID=1906 RepID=UPI0036B767E2